jgi:single-strand DNA-binding protein
MANVNKVFLIGNLTKDPELRRTQSDLSVASFAVAVNRRGKDAGVDFIDCTAWRNTADFVSKYFKKGDPILVVGSISTRSYKDKDGNNRKAVEVVADDVQFVAPKKDSNEAPMASDVEEYAAEEQELPY